MGAIIVVDALWGDAGKGKFSAYFSRNLDAQVCVRAGIGPNAGHSIYVNRKLLKTRLIPLGMVNPRTSLMIGSGVAVDPDIFLDEIKKTGVESRVFLDYRCPIIERKHIDIEKKDPLLRKIDSTMSGSGAARADYIMRRGKRASEISELKEYVIDVAYACNEAAKRGIVVVEGSQATWLSLYLSDRYPYTTSKNCTTAASMDDVGLNWKLVDRVVLLIKCLPTAVGNGPLPYELTEEEIREKNLIEYGVNTGRKRRRCKKIDMDILKYSTMLNGPTELALTYCDQYDQQMQDVREKKNITKKLTRLIESVEKATGISVRYLETGKEHDSIIDLW